MLDLEPATRTLARLIEGVRDDQLADPTPCTESSIGDLIDHVDGFCLAFTAAANKASLDGGGGPSADASRLGEQWRSRIPQRLDALAKAWKQGSAWEGMTQAGGQDLPGQAAGLVALDEVLVHGWDIAVASRQPFDCEPELREAAMGFVKPAVEQNPDGTPGLFGPPVRVADDASPLERYIALTGRDPSWKPPA